MQAILLRAQLGVNSLFEFLAAAVLAIILTGFSRPVARITGQSPGSKEIVGTGPAKFLTGRARIAMRTAPLDRRHVINCACCVLRDWSLG